MPRVHVLVEGQSEEHFVKQLLANYLNSKRTDCNFLSIQPILVKTSTDAGSPHKKGGYVPFPKVEKQIRKLLADRNAVLITTMLDFYRFPKELLPPSSLPSDPYKAVESLEGKLQAYIKDDRFLPYISLHEFESLLFADLEVFKNHFEKLCPEERDSIRHLCDQLKNVEPELINDGEETHPSKRIDKACPRFIKTVDSFTILQETGLDTVRRRCPHFAEWLSALEKL